MLIKNCHIARSMQTYLPRIKISLSLKYLPNKSKQHENITSWGPTYSLPNGSRSQPTLYVTRVPMISQTADRIVINSLFLTNPFVANLINGLWVALGIQRLSGFSIFKDSLQTFSLVRSVISHVRLPSLPSTVQKVVSVRLIE